MPCAADDTKRAMDRVERTIAELKDSLAFIRKLAAANLARAADERAIPALEAAAAGDEDAEVRDEAKRAIEKIRAAGRPESGAHLLPEQISPAVAREARADLLGEQISR